MHFLLLISQSITNQLSSYRVSLTQSQESVFWFEEDQHPPYEVFAYDVVLDVVRVMLHTERDQLKDEWEKLTRLVVIYKVQTHVIIVTALLHFVIAMSQVFLFIS